jgi:hypothetical protein
MCVTSEFVKVFDIPFPLTRSLVPVSLAFGVQMNILDPVWFHDLSVPQCERHEFLKLISIAMQRGKFILGGEVESFKKEFARAC